MSNPAAGVVSPASLSATKSQLHRAALALLLLTACTSAGPQLSTRARYLMGTTCEITLPSSTIHLADQAFEEIARIETFLSTWRADSELSRLNATPLETPAAVSPELFALLRTAIELSEKTEGSFNPLVGPLVKIWRTREEGRLPDREELQRAVALTSLRLVSFDPSDRTITRAAHVEFEEGGFGKGYALDRAVDRLRSAGAGEGFLNFAGQIVAFGSRSFAVAVAHPESRDRAAITFRLTGASLSTSSGSEKQFLIGGRSFSHIIDPRSGDALPPRGSASVIAARALDADVLSTALYVLGPDKGLQLAEKEGIAAMFLLPSAHGYEVRMSSRFRSHAVDLTVVDEFITIRNESHVS